MNRIVLSGIAMFFALVGISLVGSDSKVIAGHHGCGGRSGCEGGLLSRLHDRNDCCGAERAPRCGGHDGLFARLHSRKDCCGAPAAPACCEAPAPAPAPACCAAPAPSCCEPAPTCGGRKRLFGHHRNKCCGEAAPACGCEAAPACNSCAAAPAAAPCSNCTLSSGPVTAAPEAAAPAPAPAAVPAPAPGK